MENQVRGIVRSSDSVVLEISPVLSGPTIPFVRRMSYRVVSRGHVFPGTRACKNRNNSYRRVSIGAD